MGKGWSAAFDGTAAISPATAVNEIADRGAGERSAGERGKQANLVLVDRAPWA